MKSICAVALFYHLLGDVACRRTGLAEDDAVYSGIIVHESLKRRKLVPGVDGIVLMSYRGSPGILLSGGNLGSIMHVTPCNLFNFPGHRSREKQRGAVEREGLDYCVELILEAHIQHDIGLIENKILKTRKISRSLVYQVDHPARRSDYQLCSGLSSLI